MPTIHQRFTADRSGLEQAYNDLARDVVKLEEANRKLIDTVERGNQQTKRGLDDQTRGLRSVGRELVGVATQWGSIQTLVQAVNTSIQEQIDLDKQLKDQQITVAEAQAGLFQNLSSFSSQEKQRVAERVRGIQRSTGFESLEQLFVATGAGVSASEGNAEAAPSAVTQAARLARQTPQSLSTFSGAALDIARASGNQDARQNLGFLLAAGTQARIEDVRLQAENLAPAVASIANVAAPGTNQRQNAIEAAALFSALTVAGGDKVGRSTGTASISFATQAREFFQQSGREDPGTLAGRLAALQADETLGRAFLADSSFEKRFQVPIEQLVLGGTPVAESFRRNIGAIGFSADPFETLVRDLETGTPELRTAASERRLRQSRQTRDLADRQGAISARVLDIQRQDLVRTRERGFQLGEEFGDVVGGGINRLLADRPEEELAARLRNRRNAILHQEGLLGGRVLPLSPDQLSPEDQRRVQFIDELLKQLVDLSAERQAAGAERPEAQILTEIRDELRERNIRTPSQAALNNARQVHVEQN